MKIQIKGSIMDEKRLQMTVILTEALMQLGIQVLSRASRWAGTGLHSGAASWTTNYIQIWNRLISMYWRM